MYLDRLALWFVLSACAALALPQRTNAQTIWYVDASAAPGGDGSSWQTAFDTLQPALDLAATADQIWVAAGTYYPTTRSNPADPRSASFTMTAPRRLFGGFAGTETSISQRDPALFDDTILSGDVGVQGVTSDNAYHVILLPSFSASGFVRINGFRITGGYAVGQDSGGGIAIGLTNPGSFNPRVKLYNCTLNDNAADRGGAISVQNFGVVHLLRCTVERNTATIRGGAVNSFTGTLQAVDTRFIENKTDNLGGVLYVDSSSPPIVIQYANCVFIANTARRGGVAYIKGGAQSSGEGDFYNCTFVENKALEIGGVLYAVTNQTMPAIARIYNSILWNNSAPSSPSIFGTGLDVRYSDVQGGYPGTGNIQVDPQFLTVDQPAPGSPVNDAGSNALVIPDFLDVDGDGDTAEPLPLDILDCARRADDPLATDSGSGSAPLVDMGAYEANQQRCP
ncbi:MAG: hypothetical protein HYR85_17615 [Planctomycetes bacterium]|nr:hypothetical protein [Planctomycetota bacterium]MBI3845272.1 hypothetical protein [Planctomycetota bacterium]